MISHLHISHFKSHSQTSLNLRKINLLTGCNGMGKSSVIQALLLLRQSSQANLLSEGLNLNGDCYSIGSARQALYQGADDNLITFDLKGAKYQACWSFEVKDTELNETFVPLYKPQTRVDKVALEQWPLFTHRFQYLSAFRLGPVENHPKDTVQVVHRQQISVKEGRCELAIHFLHYFQKYRVHPALCLGDPSRDTLIAQVEAWMHQISPDIQLHIAESAGGFRIDYSFKRPDQIPTEPFSSMNVGFGVSYILPVVTAILHASASADAKIFEPSLLIIENPEAHIHPGAQAQLMRLIAKAASIGTQFIIETHSDHIINGLLVATRQGLVHPEESMIYFFDRISKEHATSMVELPVLPGGRLKNPPKNEGKGFFDQLSVDMKTLTGF